jgi:hypothetical protein
MAFIISEREIGGGGGGGPVGPVNEYISICVGGYTKFIDSQPYKWRHKVPPEYKVPKAFRECGGLKDQLETLVPRESVDSRDSRDCEAMMEFKESQVLQVQLDPRVHLDPRAVPVLLRR